MIATPLKENAWKAIEGAQDELVALGEDIFDHPEIGFKEERTSALICERLRALGLDVEEGLAITGARARLRGSRPGPTVCVMAELDALPVPGHPRADRSTGAAHACGHNAQLVHLLGVVRGLMEAEAQRELVGQVVFLVVPAEEYVDLDFRRDLAKRGKIEFLGGKPEMVRLGIFDEIDMALMVHASGIPDAKRLSMCWHYNGFIAKQVRFIGKAAHAGAAPFRGVNALNAASIALAAVHAARETFRDEDQIRVHPIITHGGDAINVVPSDVRLESFVRGASLEAIADAERKFDRAMAAGALAVGGDVEIATLPGYLPLYQDRHLGDVVKSASIELNGAEHWGEIPSLAACTDVGDLSHIMPVSHPSHGGCTGPNHTTEFRITDRYNAYVNPAKALVSIVIDLLHDDGKIAGDVVRQFQPKLTRDEYLAKVRSFMREDGFNFDGGSHLMKRIP